jgi:hypothetical protein
MWVRGRLACGARTGSRLRTLHTVAHPPSAPHAASGASGATPGLARATVAASGGGIRYRVLLELTLGRQHILYYTSLGHGARTHNLETCRLILRPARGAQGPGRRRWPVGAGPLSACGLRATEAGPATRTLRNSRTIDMMAECTTQVTASMRERTSIPHHSTRSPLTKAPS